MVDIRWRHALNPLAFIFFQMWSVRLPVSPACISKIPHDETQGRSWPRVCVPHLWKTLWEGTQPERPHVHGPPADPSWVRQYQTAAAAAVRPAHHHPDRGSSSARPRQVTTASPTLLHSYINFETPLFLFFFHFSSHSGCGLGLWLHKVVQFIQLNDFRSSCVKKVSGSDCGLLTCSKWNSQ